MTSYENQTLSKLRETARLHGLNKKIVGFWKLNKAQVIKLLRSTNNKKNTILNNQQNELNIRGIRKSKKSK